MSEQLQVLEQAGEQQRPLPGESVEKLSQDEIDQRFADVVSEIGELHIDDNEQLVEKFMNTVPREPGAPDNWRLG